MYKLICIVIGYFIGCIQSAYLVGKLLGNIDIREHGSGNAGSTNILRVMGKKAAAITFIVDLLKPMLAVLICKLIFKNDDKMLITLYSGVGVILGHNWPVFLKFKGGKGVASAIGIVLSIWNLPIILISFLIGIVSIVITKYVSLGSMLFVISLPILFSIFGYPLENILLTLLIMLIIVGKHLPNIKRLLSGKENKLGSKKSKE